MKGFKTHFRLTQRVKIYCLKYVNRCTLQKENAKSDIFYKEMLIVLFVFS
jgi:hypothetical protein